MRSLEIPKAAGVFTRHVCCCLALMLMLLYPLSAAAADRVHLQLKWQHQFQFAGYYAALAQGYYQAAGLDVEIIPCRPGEDPVQKVLQGEADFGVGSTELLLLRERGAPLVVLGVIFQHSPLVFMTLKQSGLQSIHDLVGRRVAIEPGSSELYAYLREEGISLDKLTLLPHGFDTKDLLAGNVDALSAYVTDEPFELKQAGQEYVLYSPRVAGIDFYGENLFTTESLLKLKPEMVKAFREASLKGWKYAMQHPEELVQLIYSRYSQRHSIEHLRFEADQMAPLIQTSLVEIGHMNLGRWQHIAKTYAELGMMKPDFNFTGFLYDPNPPPPDLRWLYVLIGLVALAIAVVSAIAVYIYRINARLRQEAANRKQAEETLNEAQTRMQHVISSSPVVTYTVTPDYAATWITQNVESILGYTVAECLAPGWWADHLHPDDKDSILSDLSEMRRVFKSGRNIHEYRFQFKDGFYRWIQDTQRLLSDEQGNPTEIIGAWHDITDRKQSEDALRESTEKQKLERDRLELILKTAKDGFWLADASTGRLIDANDSACSMLGYSREEFLRIGLTDLDAQWSPEEIGREMQKLKTIGNASFETRQRTKGGQIIDVEVSVNYLPATDQFFSFIRNITERKQMEDALRESEEKYRWVLNNMVDVISVMDMNLRFTYISPSIMRFRGYTVEEAMAQTLEQVMTPESLQISARVFEEEMKLEASGTADPDRVRIVEVEQYRKDGSIVLMENHLSFLRDEAKKAIGIIAVSHDITDRKLAEEELLRTKKEAEDANHAKTEFLASMSHEIRTPMNAIIGMADLLQETPMTPEQQQYVQVFQSAGENLLEIIDTILDISKVEAGQIYLEKIDFDLNDTIEKICEVMAARAQKKGLELAYSTMEDVPKDLLGDPVRLRQILINLIGNAIKFTEKGEVFIQVQKQGSGDEKVELLFSVTDTGIGISQENIDKVFEIFKQADSSTTRKYGGTGLGLAISKKLVELMGGHIQVESKQGHGSTFSFTVEFDVQTEPKDYSEKRPVDLKGLKVLLVDDNATNRMILNKILSGVGALVTEADGGEQGLAEFKRAEDSEDPFRLALIDGRMPDMDGFELVQRMKEETGGVKNTAIMMLTSDDRQSDAVRCRELDIEFCLIKPVKKANLLDSIAAILGRKAVTAVGRVPGVKPVDFSKIHPFNILLVEDSEDNRLLIQSYFKRTSDHIDIAENGEIAVEKFKSGKYDLVLMDVQMPVMDGYTATGEIRKWEDESGRRPTPIIALTAHAMKEDAQKSLDAGCTEHLTKPIRKATLMEAIQKYKVSPEK